MSAKQQTRSKSSAMDAITLLTEDHKRVQKLFRDFEKRKEDEDESRQELVKQICAELTIHAEIEEELFYPAARDAIDEQDLLDEAEVEHTSAKNLIAQLSSMDLEDELYDAKVTVLGEYINHHVKEEQDELFPKVKKAKIDLKALGEQLMERKKELESEMFVADTVESEEDEDEHARHSLPQRGKNKKGSSRTHQRS